jgi:AraC-like DNA-binding protein
VRRRVTPPHSDHRQTSSPGSPTGTADSPTSTLSSILIDTDDPDEALELSAKLFYPHRYLSVGDKEQFSFHLEGTHLAAISVGAISFNGPIAIQTPERGSYHVNIPIVGRLESTTARTELLASGNTAIVYNPTDPAVLRCLDEHTTFWGAKFETSAVEQQLKTLIGRPMNGAINFARNLDLTTEVGSTFCALTKPLQNPQTAAALAANPLLAKPYIEAVITALLMSVEHPYHDLIRLSPRPAPRPSVALAIEMIRSAPEHPWTIASLAAGAFCSARSLQAGFLRDLDTTPLTYLAQARIGRAHLDLLGGDPRSVTVTTIATNWGFAHLGRFSVNYRQTYGESPSQTLHRTK